MSKPWRTASSYGGVYQRPTKGDEGSKLDVGRVLQSFRMEPVLSESHDAFALIFRNEGDGEPLFGWLSTKCGVTRTFGPTVSGKRGIWKKTFAPEKMLFPAFMSAPHGGLDQFADIAVQRLVDDPTCEEACYVAKDMFPDGRARMWLRNKLMGVRYAGQGSSDFCVHLVDNGQTITSDWVEGAPWKCGEAIADWAKDVLTWIDRPKLAPEEVIVVRQQEAVMADSSAFALF